MKRIAMWVVLAGTVGAVTWAALGAAQSRAATVLPEAVQDALLQALTGPEGEYAAYASYAAVLDAYGEVEPYATIAVAELRHIEALERLLDKYGIDYPKTNPYLGTIEAPADLATAAAAWADGEVANVALYDDILPVVAGYSDITRVFTSLRTASQDAHLPAFQRAAENGGTLASGPATGLGASIPRQGRGGNFTSGRRSETQCGKATGSRGTNGTCATTGTRSQGVNQEGRAT